MRDLEESASACSALKEYLPERVCSTSLQARTEFTPRTNPESTSIVSILKPSSYGSLPSLSEGMLYEGNDVRNPALMLARDDIDVHAIVINRRAEESFNDSSVAKGQQQSFKMSHLRRRLDGDEIVPGIGWELDTLPGICDGTSTSICGRQPSSDCLLYGHMDKRGGLIGDESSGWLVMNLSNMTEGIVMLNFESSDSSKSLSEDFAFKYAIQNEIVSLSKDEFVEKKKSPQEKVDVITLLDDPNFVEGSEGINVEVSIRFENCEGDCSFKLTHVYWA